jgi:hypothetical protein
MESPTRTLSVEESTAETAGSKFPRPKADFDSRLLGPSPNGLEWAFSHGSTHFSILNYTPLVIYIEADYRLIESAAA